MALYDPGPAGFILNFEQAANARGIDPRNYMTAYGTPLHSQYPVSQKATFDRAAAAEPTILGYSGDFPEQDAGNLSLSLMIKKKDSYDIGLPAEIKFCLPMAGVVSLDVLEQYGSLGFYESEILLIVKQSMVENGMAGRPAFADWHDHIHDPKPYDLAYLFANDLPSKYKRDEEIRHTQRGALTRMGAEEQHASSVNLGPAFWRVWGAFSVSPNIRESRPFNISGNPVLSSSEEKYAEFREAADEMFTSRNTFSPVTPIPLYSQPALEAA